ncbi:unnamed protein product, partial [Polarella glacialis]
DHRLCGAPDKYKERLAGRISYGSLHTRLAELLYCLIHGAGRLSGLRNRQEKQLRSHKTPNPSHARLHHFYRCIWYAVVRARRTLVCQSWRRPDGDVHGCEVSQIAVQAWLVCHPDALVRGSMHLSGAARCG